MNLSQCYLIENDCYKAARALKPTGIVVHSTGANNKNLKRYVQPSKSQAQYMNNMSRQEMLTFLGVNSYNNHWNKSGLSKCVHAFIGAAAQGQIAAVQTLPWNVRCWGVGSGRKGSYNASHIQFEICEDSLVDRAYFDAAFGEAAQLCAYLCRKYNLSVSSIVGHAEAHRAGYGSNHSDPEHWMKKHGKTMADFRADVQRLLTSKGSYLVRVTAASLNVRSGPGVSYAIRTTVRANEVYTIVDEQGGWGKLKSGAGWVNLKYTTRVAST